MLSILRTNIRTCVIILAGIGILGHSLGIVGQVFLDQPLFGLPIWSTMYKTLVEVFGICISIVLLIGAIRKSRIMCYFYVVGIVPYIFLLVVLTTYMSHIIHCFKFSTKLALSMLLPTCTTLLILNTILSGVVVFVKQLKKEETLERNQSELKKESQSISSAIPVDRMDNVV